MVRLQSCAPATLIGTGTITQHHIRVCRQRHQTLYEHAAHATAARLLLLPPRPLACSPSSHLVAALPPVLWHCPIRPIHVKEHVTSTRRRLCGATPCHTPHATRRRVGTCRAQPATATSRSCTAPTRALATPPHPCTYRRAQITARAGRVTIKYLVTRAPRTGGSDAPHLAGRHAPAQPRSGRTTFMPAISESTCSRSALVLALLGSRSHALE